MPKKTVYVQWTLCNGRACFGITDDKSWFYYGYNTFEIAADRLKRYNLTSDNLCDEHTSPVRILDIHGIERSDHVSINGR